MIPLLALCLLPCVQDQRLVGYVFTLDGQAISPELITLHGDVDQPRSGDVVWVDHFHLVLDEPGAYHFEGKRSRHLWRIHDDGRREIIGLSADWTGGEPPPQDVDWGALRGLRLGARSALWMKALRDLDLRRCYLELEEDTPVEEPLKLPPELGYLDLSRTEFTHISFIEEPEELRYLRLPERREIEDASGIAGAKQLRYLRLSGTRIRDLSALDGHPELRRLDVSDTLAARLPRELPRLEHFTGYAWDRPEEEVERLRREHPEATILAGYSDLLARRLRGSARLRVRTGATCHRRPEYERQVFETDDRDEIAGLIDLLQVSDGYDERDVVVPGCGGFTMEFADGDGDEDFAIGILGTSLLRVRGLWEADCRLLIRSARPPFRAWMAERGVQLRP